MKPQSPNAIKGTQGSGSRLRGVVSPIRAYGLLLSVLEGRRQGRYMGASRGALKGSRRVPSRVGKEFLLGI